MFIIFDTETTGLPLRHDAPLNDLKNWPRMVQLAWETHDEQGDLTEAHNYIIKPEGFEIPYDAVKIHGITTEKAINEGYDLVFVLNKFVASLLKNKVIIGHNIEFDIKILGAELLRKNISFNLHDFKQICTKVVSTDYCKLPGGKGGNYKWPNLTELHTILFSEGYEEAHNASTDVAATARCFFELLRLGIINAYDLGIEDTIIRDFRNNHTEKIKPIEIIVISNKDIKKQSDDEINESSRQDTLTEIPQFTHLHVHTQYSILDGAADIKGLITKARKDGMVALAITDHGNMFGVKEFQKVAKKEGIKPILGCEVYVARRTRFDKKDKIDANGDHLVLLAKNRQGYRNLIKLVSYGWLQGFYYHPRIDNELLKEYHEGLIVSSACLGGVIPQKIKSEGIEEAEKIVLEYKSLFGDDFYLELQRHKSNDPEIDKEVYQDQIFVNKILLELGKKHNIKCIASNDVHFIESQDAAAQDRLLCLNTGKDLNDPKRMRYTGQEWMKTRAEMAEIFSDIPEVLINTNEIVEKIEDYDLNRPLVMPDFVIPEGYTDADEYLRHITYEGAVRRWPDLTDEIKERIDFELGTIKKMGYPGYFLIVWDFLKAARDMGVSVGPGRGSAAGSVVAYCLRITEIDPLKYDLLFERFLNPDRISMPDIDIDFDEDGRAKVLEYVVKKYGDKRVAHIITFGSMAAKSAIRDVARVQGLPLSEADRLAKMVPERPGITLKEAYEEVPQLKLERDSGNPEIASVLQYAETLEGSVRNTGTHACGIIIGKEDLENYIPISTAKDSELTYVTQFDGSQVEDAGLLKMDFLGLKTLSIIKDAMENIKISKGKEIDIENVPLDDAKTFNLYSKGETTGLFQFESDGMKKYLRELKPTCFGDLIAMNALYRPGPMDNIPDFIKRKHGKAKIQYDFPVMEEVLKETYGITVYQEQVMKLSQIMAGFSRGEADSLRKAMGKKIHRMMNELKPKFIEGCRKLHNLDETKVLKVWEDWEKFASYAFNKSHATCYSYVSYQTAYLKAHYPAEFMAAVLSRHLNDIKKLTFFLDECRRMGLKVLGPDVNESYTRFTVNKVGNIRIGLAAIKGVGEGAVENIIDERKKNGNYNSLFDFIERVNLSTINKKTVEALALAGAFDCFKEIKREHFDPENTDITFTDELLKYGNNLKNERRNPQQSLFGGANNVDISKPKISIVHDWNILKKLNTEKNYVGIYHSAHPLDDYRFEMKHLCTHQLAEMQDLSVLKDKEIVIGGMVTEAQEKFTRTNKPYGSLIIEDFSDSYNIRLFSKDYMNFKQYFTKGYQLLIKGRVQEREWGDSHELELKIKNIQMLAEAKDDMIQNLTMSMELADLSENFIKNFEKLIGKNKGKIMLKFYIYNPAENLKLEMFSRNQKISLSAEVIDFLENSPEIQFNVS